MSNLSWKQYGGVQKTDRFQSLGIGTLVADQVLLKQKNTTNFNINGSLLVTGDIQTSGGGNVYSSNDLYALQNTYLNNHLYFGTQVHDTTNNYGFFYGDSTKSTFGINGLGYGGTFSTISSSSTFDIYSNNTTTFSARTTQSSINNILAQNATLDSINVQANRSVSEVDFVVAGNIISKISSNTSQLTLQSPQITLTSANNISIVSANGSNFTANTGDTVLKSLTGNMYIQVPAGNTNISSNGTTIIDSSAGIQIKTNLGISNRGIYSSIAGEILTIYDISKNPYLYDYYENTVANTGSALTIVASDSNSNTFLNIFTPSKNGFSIGGGTSIADYTRSMGTFGITSTNGNYIPSQTIISGNNIVKYLTTTGINTYVPKSEIYVLDINGPTRIGNGEINTMLRMTYEVFQMNFSKRSQGYGMAVGSPSSITNPYNQIVSYTSNGGKTWSQVNVSTNLSDALITQPQTINIYTYNQNYSFISSSSLNSQSQGLNIIYYTKNGGSSWTQLGDTNNSTIHKAFSTININDRVDGTCTLLIAGSNTSSSPSKNQLFYYPITSSLASFSFPTSISFNSVDVSLNTINNSDGSGNFLYLVGSGIQKYDVSGTVPVPLYTVSLNSTNNFNSIFAFDSSYAIAVGNSIYYTVDSINWRIANTTNLNDNSFNLKSVHIFDLSNAIAVGDSGVIAYTTNGSLTWQNISPTILNSAGTSSRITNPNNNLRGVFMPDLNSFVIADVSTSYVSSSTISTLGKSKILYGFFPNVFNRTNNKVLDVSGNSEFTGDIIIDGSGKLFVSSDVSFNSRLFVSSDLSLNSRLFVGNDVSLNAHLSVGSVATFNSQLYVANDLILTGTANMRSTNNIVGVLNDTVSLINMGGATSGITLGGYSTTVQIPNSLTVNGTTNMSNLYVSQTTYSQLYDGISNTINIGSSTANKTINISSFGAPGNNATIYIGRSGDNVFLQGNVSTIASQTLTVNTNKIQINEGSLLPGYTSYGSGIQIRDNQNDLAGYLLVTQDMQGYSFKAPKSSNVLRFDMNNLVATTATGAMVTVQQSSSIFADSSFDLIVNNNIDGNYNGSGNFYVGTKSYLNSDVQLNSRLFVANDVSLSGGLYVKGNALLNGKIQFSGDISFNSAIQVMSTGIFGSNIAINKSTIAPNVVLDISGNMNQIGGVVFQF
jgi:photosystem II stability/assembly factor-like uncharacterized protein